MKEIFIAIDPQVDFVTGTLPNKEAQKAVPKVEKAFRHALDTEAKIKATKDTHSEKNDGDYIAYADTLEGKKLPIPHCFIHSEGWSFVPEIKKLVSEAAKKETGSSLHESAIVVQKPTFGSLNLMYEISDFVSKYKKICPNEEIVITLVGFDTDICVISNALLLRSALPNIRIRVIADCCAGVTPEKHQAALSVMESCQIDIINLEEYLAA